MEEHKVQVGITPELELRKNLSQQSKGSKDTSVQTRRKIFIGIIAFVLIVGVYLTFFRKTPQMPLAENSNSLQQESEEELKSYQQFTADVIRSISTPLEKTNKEQNQTALENDYGNGMVVLKEASQGRYTNRPEISIPPTSLLTAHLERKVKASSIQTPVVAVVDEDLEQGEKIIVPSGTKLTGYTLGIQGNDRVLIQFNSLILPDNTTVYRFSGVAVDEDENQGIEGESTRGTIYKAGTSLASTILGLGMDSALSDNQSVFGEVMRQTAQNTTQDLSSAMSQTANASEQSTMIVLAKDTPIKILVTDNYQ